MDDDSKRRNGGATAGDAPEQDAANGDPQVNDVTAAETATDGGATGGAADSSKKRSQSFGSRLSSFGQKSRPEPKQRTVDEIRVADGALASIIGLAAHEVPGVVGMAPASITEGIRRILGARQVDEGVVIEHPNGPERADVDLHVVVAYGVNIPVVADSIRERVRYASQSLAGITLDEVRVHVAGISRG